MRRKIKQSAFAMTGRAARLLPRRRPGEILIVETAHRSFDSLGDQAMLRGLTAEIKESTDARVVVGSYTADERWLSVPGVEKVVPLRFTPRPWSYLRLARSAAGLGHGFIVGGDVIDGKYGIGPRWLAGKYLAAAGVPLTISGFSFNAAPTEESLRFISSLPASTRFMLRDPLSAERFRQHASRDCELVADAAFMLRPDAACDLAILGFVDRARSRGDCVIGLNINRHMLPSDDASRDTVVAAIRRALPSQHAGRGLSVLFIPHDGRGTANDAAFAHALSCQQAFEPHRWRIAPIMSAGQVKFLCGRLDLVVTGRMHLAIASLGAGTPVLAFTYQDKFEGLFQHFGLEGVATDVLTGAEPAELAGFVRQGLDRRDKLRSRIRAALDRVLALSRRNLAGVMDPTGSGARGERH